MRNLFLIILITLGSVLVNAQNLVLPLYGKAEFEKIASLDDEMPELHVYLTDKLSSQAVVVCPGGGYKGLSFGSEGVSVAKWLNQNGIAAFVVKYRMPAGRQEVPVEDLTRAFEIVMANADKWNLDSCRIGLMGFSAGGHLAATGLVTLKGELKPDFGILVYPVISMKKNITHQFSRFNLMGKSPSEDTVIKFSTEEQVAEDTPATILFHCSDDPAVKPENSIVFYQALLRNAVPAEMHVYPKGRHGWGFIEGAPFPYFNEFKTTVLRWIAEQNN